MDSMKPTKEDTLSLAAALLEDFTTLQKIGTTKAPQPSQLRNASAILRRTLLNEAELKRVAGPRIGKVEINHISIDQSVRDRELEFIPALIGRVYYTDYENLMLIKHKEDVDPRSFPIFRESLGSLGRFLTSPRIIDRQETFTNQDVISYAANHLSGVHSYDPNSVKDKAAADASVRYLIEFAEAGTRIHSVAPEGGTHFSKSEFLRYTNIFSYALQMIIFDLLNCDSVKRLGYMISKEIESHGEPPRFD